MIAEESTSWPNVSRPTDQGGLGFGFQVEYGVDERCAVLYATGTSTPPLPSRQTNLRHRVCSTKNFILSLSHDEVVHLKKSLFGKMPGDEAAQLANLRLLYTFMYGHPGKKLLFMGGEFGQSTEWNDNSELNWEQARQLPHQHLQHFVADLNKLYGQEPAFYQVDFRSAGFEWLDANGAETNVLAFLRKARDPRDSVVFVLNFSDQHYKDYRIGVPFPAEYRELLNSDAG